MKIIPQFSEWSDAVELPEKVLLTDPCYKPGTWCTQELSIKAGNWFGCGFFPVDQMMVKFAEKCIQEVEDELKETKNNLKWLFLEYGVILEDISLETIHKNIDEVKLFSVTDQLKFASWFANLKCPIIMDRDVIENYNEGRVQMHCSSLMIVHENYKDDERFSRKNILNTFKYVKPVSHGCCVDSGQIGIFDAQKYKENYSDEFYDLCCDKYCLDETAPDYYSQYKKSRYYPYIPVHKGINGFNINTYYGDMPFKLKTVSDENGQVIAIMINTKRF